MEDKPRQLPKPIRLLLLVAGSLSLILGLVGLFVPVLPTTPFLLVSAACYARGSHRFYDWLIHHPWFGEYIRNYREGKGIEKRHKTAALVLLWSTILASAIFFVNAWWLRGILVAIASGVTIHLLSMPTFQKEKPSKPEA